MLGVEVHKKPDHITEVASPPAVQQQQHDVGNQ